MNDKTAEPKELCKTIYEDIKDYARKHHDETTGCNFTYTEEKYWSSEKKILLLTLNPHANRNEPRCIPTSPWPDTNAFLDKKTNFGIKDNILTILAEIAKHKTGDSHIVASCEDEKLAGFVNDNVILASYIPFRTPGAEGITKDMKIFARKKYWSKLLQILKPEVIITTGNYPFDRIRIFLKKMGCTLTDEEPVRTCTFHPQDLIPPSSGKYKTCHCQHPTGKTTHLIGVPHPAANRVEKNPVIKYSTNWGYPDPNRYPPNEAPIQKFLREKLKHINF